MSAQTLLSSGNKWFSYSGIIFGDVSVPVTIQLNFIPNTGLKDSVIRVIPFYGAIATSTGGQQLGLEVKLDDTTIYKSVGYRDYDASKDQDGFQLFIPRQSKLEVISLNTSGNNSQERGCNILGYYI
jgi:hypothetical protein